MELLKKDGAYAMCPFSCQYCSTSCPIVKSAKTEYGKNVYYCGFAQVGYDDAMKRASDD